MEISPEDIIEKKIRVLLELRGYKQLEREESRDGVYIKAEKRDGEKILIWAIPTEGTTGKDIILRFKKRINEEGAKEGILLTNGRYTVSAISEAEKRNIELIPQNFPTFNIFEHVLVPKHEILTPQEREALLKKYRVKPYQIPNIRASDPVVRAIGAKPGDILRIYRKSPTAGTYISYRYVVEDQ
ncbi:DNA-directed RNA polymerase subunit H [Candidatus Bathyarchaeota archaeon]|nr:MAG: DNA-directed RNA polymerase subunit H [Candidatus Bathyarchaeota archaeon]